jgi:hypothetical protein
VIVGSVIAAPVAAKNRATSSAAKPTAVISRAPKGVSIIGIVNASTAAV